MGHQLDAPDPDEPQVFILSDPPTAAEPWPGPIDAGVVAMVVEWCAGPTR